MQEFLAVYEEVLRDCLEAPRREFRLALAIHGNGVDVSAGEFYWIRSISDPGQVECATAHFDLRLVSEDCFDSG